MNAAIPAFSDSRVFVISTRDASNPTIYADDSLGHHQACDGPTYIVVGPGVTDQRLQRNLPDLARFGVTLEQLQRARDQARV